MLYYTRLEKLHRDKHSSLLGLFVSYKVSEVLWIWLLVCYKTFCGELFVLMKEAGVIFTPIQFLCDLRIGPYKLECYITLYVLLTFVKYVCEMF